MVAFLKNNILLVSLVMSIFLGNSSCTKFNIKFDRDAIVEICSETADPSFCWKLLRSNPWAQQPDVSALETYLVKNANHVLFRTIKLIYKAIKNVTDPNLKMMYGTCWGSYKSAIGYNESALKALAAKDYSSFFTSVFSVNSLAEDCKDGLNLLSTKPDPLIMRNIDDVMNVCDITLVLYDKLPGNQILSMD